MTMEDVWVETTHKPSPKNEKGNDNAEPQKEKAASQGDKKYPARAVKQSKQERKRAA